MSPAPAPQLEVASGEGTYPIHVEPGVLEWLPAVVEARTGAERVALVSDDRVAPLHAERAAEACREAGLDTTLLTFPAGEASKTRKTWSILTDRMLEAGLGRDAAVVALGGGVTTDLGGFVAATYLRGVPVVQVPTSYLAMVDASVGGKTGVDVKAGKNLVGTFHAPAAVVIDPRVLGTLPRVERAQGLVEAVKHGAILDRAHFESVAGSLDALLSADPEAAAEHVLASVRLKARVVEDDERESGLRRVLNFGHTVGHAVEAASGYALGHGAAVALGMRAEARLGERLGVTEEGTASLLEEVLRPLMRVIGSDTRGGGLATAPDLDATLSYLAVDKKSLAGTTRCVLLRRVGEVSPGEGWTYPVSGEQVRDALVEVLARS